MYKDLNNEKPPFDKIVLLYDLETNTYHAGLLIKINSKGCTFLNTYDEKTCFTHWLSVDSKTFNWIHTSRCLPDYNKQIIIKDSEHFLTGFRSYTDKNGEVYVVSGSNVKKEEVRNIKYWIDIPLYEEVNTISERPGNI